MGEKILATAQIGEKKKESCAYCGQRNVNNTTEEEVKLCATLKEKKQL